MKEVGRCEGGEKKMKRKNFSFEKGEEKFHRKIENLKKPKKKIKFFLEKVDNFLETRGREEKNCEVKKKTKE